MTAVQYARTILEKLGVDVGWGWSGVEWCGLVLCAGVGPAAACLDPLCRSARSSRRPVRVTTR